MLQDSFADINAMKKSFIYPIILFFVILALYAPIYGQENSAEPEEGVLFEFRQKKGESSLHISTIEEEAYLNGRLQNRVQIVNRTATTITDTNEDGSAELYTHYMTTENYLMSVSGRHLSWGEEDSVNVTRTKSGELLNPDNDFLPTVQNVPSFPKSRVKPGDTWRATGKEVHDCRELFAMSDAISIPFTADYTYAGDEVIDGVKLNVIDVYYEFSQGATPSRRSAEYGTYAGASGFAQQKIWWDSSKGDIDHYVETFMIKMVDIMGTTYTFKSSAHGEVLEYKSVNDEATVEKLQERVNDLALKDINISRGKKGLTISLENIQFEPDSDVLLPKEKEKLKKIGDLLKDYSNDLLITGHCAERGTPKTRQILSEQRAEAVASYLEKLGVRDSLHIFTQGKGSTEPIASNATEEGRKKNRRVEIILAD